MRTHDEFKEQTAESLDVSALYRAVLASIAAEQPEPKRKHYSIALGLRPVGDGLPCEFTNTGLGRHRI